MTPTVTLVTYTLFIESNIEVVNDPLGFMHCPIFRNDIISY